MDISPDPYLDKLVVSAARICRAPIAMVNFLDDGCQYVKAKTGCTIDKTSRDVAMCAYTIEQDDLLIVPDATLDERFKNNPYVVGEPYLRFYAGAPVMDFKSKCFATICVLDYVPRTLDRAQQINLRQLALLVASRIRTYSQTG